MFKKLLRWFRLHKIKTVLLVLLLLFLSFALYMIRPDTYLPHKRIVIHAPYSFNDPPVQLIPMGEKIYHAKAPLGHPGIDFQWATPNSKVLSSSDGRISSIHTEFDKWDKWEIDVDTWPYVVRYKELETYNTNLKTGQHVKIGDFLGYPANPKAHNEVGAFQIHWEFASQSNMRDRFCPMTYFDQASRESVQKIWDNTKWQYKNQYPYVCSGDYHNRAE